MTDFSYYPNHPALGTTDKIIHFYCVKCGSHYHTDKWYTQDEWFFYINEMTYEQYQKKAREEYSDGE
jgi:hypothetical protein